MVSVVAAVLVAFAIVVSVGLQGCGGSPTPSPTPVLFQSFTAGACRTADNKVGDHVCMKKNAEECEQTCKSDSSCVAYETTTDDVECGKCEIHKTAITQVEPFEHPNHMCFRKVDFEGLSPGACRTAEGGAGNFVCKKQNPEECMKTCLGDASCVAYETKPEGGDCGCEIHNTTITDVELEDHPDHRCYVINPSVPDLAFQKFPAGACRTAEGDAGKFRCVKKDTCRQVCLDQASCVAYETSTETRDCECEIHNVTITKVDAGDDHAGHQCVKKVKITALSAGACRTAEDGPGEFGCAVADAEDCRQNCLDLASCVAFETKPGNNCTCEIHVAKITKSLLKDHPDHRCYTVSDATAIVQNMADYII